MTIRLASDGPQTVRADTIGAAWLAVAGRILAEGVGRDHRQARRTGAAGLRDVLEEYR